MSLGRHLTCTKYSMKVSKGNQLCVLLWWQKSVALLRSVRAQIMVRRRSNRQRRRKGSVTIEGEAKLLPFLLILLNYFFKKLNTGYQLLVLTCHLIYYNLSLDSCLESLLGFSTQKHVKEKKERRSP